ncbi:MAG: CaiB/BaiF CoA transferase family protein [Acidimicrobiales bacterium]
MSLLSPYRVLDLTDERGQLAGQVLADLGAEVILVEPPGGSRSRHLGPFVDGHENDPEFSLRFWSYNRGKRSVVADLDTPEGRQQVRDLAATADAVIESDRPGAMAARGLGYDDLSAANPGLVYASVTPFGQTGPRSSWAATDLGVAAAGMHMILMGDADRAPLRMPLDQAYQHASLDAAVGVLLALQHRGATGAGQQVDVSAQQSITQATQSTTLCSLYNSPLAERSSGGIKLGPFTIRLRSPASDGYVSALMLFGEAIGPFGARLFEWIDAEGMAGPADREIDWIDFVDGVMTGRIPLDEYDRIQDVAERFMATKTKNELLQESLDRRLLIVPVSTMADLADSEQLIERAFWTSLEVPGIERKVRFPGRFARFTTTPLDTDHLPPRLGADTAAMLGDGAGAEARAPIEVVVPARAARVGTAAASAADEPAGILAGLKVLDLMWVMAGPAATRILADHGATVVRVESATKVETARTIQPFLNDEGGAENSGLYQNMNAGKLGLSLDLTKPEARDVVLDLVKWADVVCESFSPRAMKAWGLSYDDIREIKPDVIMTSSCLFGQSGPLSSLAGYGTMGAAVGGFYAVTGWPDRPPAGCFGAYTDYVAPRYLAAAILAAVDHRDRTGEGQYIDLSQSEASIGLLGPAFLDYEINGRDFAPAGNRDPVMAPHGAFPTTGDDQWITIVCETDGQWRALCQAAGFPADWADLDQAARKAREDEIEAAITAWSATQKGDALEADLQQRGVAAVRILRSDELAADPHTRYRGHFIEVPHEQHGTVWVEAARTGLVDTPARTTSGGPTLGEHTFQVLTEILGYDGDQIAELAIAEALE